MPKLPDDYRPVPVGRVILWVWAIVATLSMGAAIAIALVLWAMIGKLSPFVGEAGCAAYWSFVLDAKQAGVEVEQIEQMYDELGATGDYRVAETCGSVADLYATMP